MGAERQDEIDGGGDPIRLFANRLRRLQVEAGGPSVRELVRLTERIGAPYTRGTIHDKLAGRSAAPWEFVAAFVRACALHAGTEPDHRQWRAWHAQMERDLAVQRVGRRQPIRPSVCPYRGLEIFTAEHAAWFRGRDAAIEQVLAGMDAHRRGVLVLGPSGSGKSSLVQAGVLPAVAAGRLPDSDRWSVVVARPGKDLISELDGAGLLEVRTRSIAEAVAAKISSKAGASRLLLVIDQFEELLTPAGGDEQVAAQTDALDQLAAAIGAPALTVVLVLRDDFYPRLASQAPRILSQLAPSLVNVPATLGPHDLRDIIATPAEAAGLNFEDGLIERIITDAVASASPSDAGRQAPVTVLPLLELTLQQLWHRRQRGHLTHDGYQRIGGITGALTTWSDTAMDQLNDEQRPIARQILTSLVRAADDEHNVPAVRQQVTLPALRELVTPVSGAAADAGATADDVLAVLTDRRVVITRSAGHSGSTSGPPVAELVHDSLIRDWPALRRWVEQDRNFQDWLRRARERLSRWTTSGQAGDLLHGSELVEGLSWRRQRRLPDDIASFVTASHRRERAAIRRSRAVSVVLASLLAIAVAAAGLALWQRQAALGAHRLALSRQLAAQSTVLIRTNPDLAGLLAVQAYRARPTTEATASIYAAAALPLLHRLTGHTDEVYSVTFSPDGSTLATAGADGTVRLWSSADGRALVTLTDHSGEISSVAFSPDGRTLATAGAGGVVRLWDISDGQVRATLRGGHATDLSSTAFSPDGRLLATAGNDDDIRLWDVASGRIRATFTGHTGDVSSVAFSPDGRTLASGSEDRSARLWDVNSGQVRRVLTGHDFEVLSVAFSPDGRTLATGSTDGSARLWDVTSGRPRTTMAGHYSVVLSVAFSPDGRTLATGAADTTVRLWDVATGQPRSTLTGHTAGVFAVSFGPDGRRLASGSADGTARLWDVATGQPRTPLAGHTGDVYSVEFSPAGGILASGGADSTIRLWDLATGQTRAVLTGHTHEVVSLAFSPDGRTLASASRDHTVRLWDVATGQVRATLTGHADEVSQAVFSPDGHTLASGSVDQRVRLWNVETQSLIATLQGHTDLVSGVVFSPDGSLLATISGDTTVRLWDTATMQARATLTGHTAAMYGVAFSPDGRTLATGSLDDSVKLWDVATMQTRITLTGSNADVFGVAFSPDGTMLATGHSDDTVRIWEVSLPTVGAAVDRICSSVGRDLTAQERETYLPSDQTSSAAC